MQRIINERNRLRNYLSSFPTPEEIKNELSNQRFPAEVIREDGKIKYLGDIQLVFDELERPVLYVAGAEQVFQGGEIG